MKTYYLTINNEVIDNDAVCNSALITDGFNIDSDNIERIDDYVDKYCRGIKRKISFEEAMKLKYAKPVKEILNIKYKEGDILYEVCK